ncbi:phage terminase small subunit [Massilimicrobiota sp. An80]|uniref:phage terminase small subunit n=1 Tax=Massilimicrobiota sp. An80 TaxID=1965658 RepID=UPI000B43BE13|nr:phage terminase small subunit [Massilimicrobiota sp. An80]OUN38298.1 hypothetical protein B5G32_01220 [Massilimicrobiota sp. An80]
MKENWELAYEDYKKGLKRKEIAEKYNVSINTVKSWKTRHWNKMDKKEGAPPKKKRGAPLGNKNATGPPGNKHAEKHGFFSKWLPEETQQIIGEMPTNEIDTLWMNIQLQFAAIIRAQKLMYVHDQEDKTIEKIEEKDGNVIGERWEVQQAWDKQATFLSAQSRAMKTLESMIKQYNDMLHKNWDMVTEEQKERVNLIRAQINAVSAKTNENDTEEGVMIVNDLPRG